MMGHQALLQRGARADLVWMYDLLGLGVGVGLGLDYDLLGVGGWGRAGIGL